MNKRKRGKNNVEQIIEAPESGAERVGPVAQVLEQEAQDPEILDAETGHGQDAATIEEAQTPESGVYGQLAELGIRAQIEELKRMIDAAKQPPVTSAPATGLPKNQVPGKPRAVNYVLLTKSMADWGKVPQQQRDVAAILSGNLQVNEPVSEAKVFELLAAEARNYTSLANSRQDPTYVFKYYRGLKNDGKHGGFVARGFLRQV